MSSNVEPTRYSNAAATGAATGPDGIVSAGHATSVNDADTEAVRSRGVADDTAAMASGGIPSPGPQKLTNASLEVGKLMLAMQQASYDSQAESIAALRSRIDALNAQQTAEMQKYCDHQPEPKSGILSGIFTICSDIVHGDFRQAARDIGSYVKDNFMSIIGFGCSFAMTGVGIVGLAAGGSGAVLVVAGIAALGFSVASTVLADPKISEHITGSFSNTLGLGDTVAAIVMSAIVIVPAVISTGISIISTFATGGAATASAIGNAQKVVSAVCGIVKGVGGLVQGGLGIVETANIFQAGNAQEQVMRLKAESTRAAGVQNQILEFMKGLLANMQGVTGAMVDIARSEDNRNVAAASGASADM